MKLNLNKESLHHAYILKGDSDALSRIYDFLDSIYFSRTQNPDLLVKEVETFTIDDARSVKDFQNQKSVSGDKKFIIILTKYFSHQAQHAMLKVLEEPAEGVHFFIVTNELSVILPTLKSRLIEIKGEDKESDKEILKEVLNFIKGEKEDRLKIVNSIVKKFEKEETSIPLKSYASLFLDTLEKEISKEKNRQDFDIEFLWKAKDYIHDQGASVKNLLEVLALTF
jgi:hypothetical protein